METTEKDIKKAEEAIEEIFDLCSNQANKIFDDVENIVKEGIKKDGVIGDTIREVYKKYGDKKELVFAMHILGYLL